MRVRVVVRVELRDRVEHRARLLRRGRGVEIDERRVGGEEGEVGARRERTSRAARRRRRPCRRARATSYTAIGSVGGLDGAARRCGGRTARRATRTRGGHRGGACPRRAGTRWWLQSAATAWMRPAVVHEADALAGAGRDRRGARRRAGRSRARPPRSRPIRHAVAPAKRARESASSDIAHRGDVDRLEHVGGERVGEQPLARVARRCRGSRDRTAPSGRVARPSRRACTSRRRRRSRAAAWCRSARARRAAAFVVRLLAVRLLRLGWTYTLPLNTPCDAPSRIALVELAAEAVRAPRARCASGGRTCCSPSTMYRPLSVAPPPGAAERRCRCSCARARRRRRSENDT